MRDLLAVHAHVHFALNAAVVASELRTCVMGVGSDAPTAAAGWR